MIERTAASLEPCTLQRVLPPAKTSFKSRRRLHTAFWQHGAADIELSSAWQILFREHLESLNLFPNSRPQTRSSSQPQAHSTSTVPLTSSFLLDFLYPQGAASLLRRPSPPALDKFERPRLYLRGAAPRLFTSSASLSQRSRPAAQETTTEDPAEAPPTQDEAFQAEEKFPDSNEEHFEREFDQYSENELEDGRAELDEGPGTELDEESGNQHDESEQDSERPTIAGATRRGRREVTGYHRNLKLQTLSDLLQKGSGDDFVVIWRAFHSTTLKPQDRDEYRAQFLDYVTKRRSLSQLLARAIDLKHWETLWAIWGRYPKAHVDNAKVLNFKDLEEILSLKKLMLGLHSIVMRIQRAEKAPLKQTEPELSNTLLKNFVYPTIRWYITQSDPKHYMPLLKIMKDPLLYEDFLMFTTNAKQRETAHELYTVYRQLPEVKIRGHIMHSMVDRVYIFDNPAGMEMVMDDALARFGRLDIPLYRKCMIFYSRRGDIHVVKRLWHEYTTHYAEERKRNEARHPPDSMKENSNPDFLPLLHAHAVRGEVQEARELFTAAQNQYGQKLNALCWNTLLNAHAKAGEYDAAVRVFGVLMQAVTPDSWSFGTIMGMTGSRGDLEFTLELYRIAKNQGIDPTATMVDCVVEAYCQNDKFGDAESIVRMTTEKERFTKTELVTLWNTLLEHHANRRDLTAVNRLLNEMTDFKLHYDSDTYSVLLRGLALCRQPHHALYLIQEAVKTHSFKPTLEHYSLLMSSFIQTGQAGEVFRTSHILSTLGMPQTGSILQRVLQGLKLYAQNPPGGGGSEESTKYLVSALRQFRQSIEWGQKPQKAILRRRAHDSPWIQQSPDPDSVRSRTQNASILIFAFAQMRNVADVPEVLRLWKSSSPEASNKTEPPIRLLQALMSVALYEGDYDELRDIWKLVLDRVVRMSHVSAPGSSRKLPLPSMRYMLNGPLKMMQRMYALTGDTDGLRETVAMVLSAGFRLDSKNWNYYVQVLAGMKKWREAFIVCEEQLMPYWRGWRNVRAKTPGVLKNLPLQLRRRGTDPHMPRPISYTLTVLTKSYMDLEQMSAWSSEAERLLKYINQKAPSAVAAVQTQLRLKNTYEQMIMMGMTPEEVSERLGERRRAERERKAPGGAPRKGSDDRDGLDGMPLAFQEMMMSAEAGAGEAREGDWGQDEWGLDEAQGEGDVARDLADEDVQDAVLAAAQDDDGWYDVEQHEYDTWAPMSLKRETASASVPGSASQTPPTGSHASDAETWAPGAGAPPSVAPPGLDGGEAPAESTPGVGTGVEAGAGTEKALLDEPEPRGLKSGPRVAGAGATRQEDDT